MKPTSDLHRNFFLFNFMNHRLIQAAPSLAKLQGMEQQVLLCTLTCCPMRSAVTPPVFQRCRYCRTGRFCHWEAHGLLTQGGLSHSLCRDEAQSWSFFLFLSQCVGTQVCLLSVACGALRRVGDAECS